MKYTVKDESGENILAESEKIDGLWRDSWDPREVGDNESFLSQSIHPYNLTNNTVEIKDIILTEVPFYGEIFKYEFNNEFDYDGRWLRIGEGNTKIADGALQIADGGWPTVNISASEGYYEFSYKVKAADACAGVLNTYENISGMNFGQYYAGQSIALGIKSEDYAADSGFPVTNKNVWYTVKVSFSANAGEEYAKYAVLDDYGNEVYKKAYYEIKKSNNGEFGTEIVFWNQGGGAFYYIDDVTLTKLEKPAVKSTKRILLDEDFDSGVYDSAAWTGAVDVMVDNGALKFPSNGYIYFNIPNKVKEKAYRITYDIKSDAVRDSDKLGSLHMYGENNSLDETANSNGMSMFNTKNGLYHADGADLENRIPKYAIGKNKIQTNKWYTVEIEFSESGGANNTGFIRMNLIDKETGRVIDDGFEVALGYAADQPNKTKYCLWSCSDTIGGTEYENPDFYIDNFKVEELDMVYKRAVMKDLAGRDVTAHTGVTPALSTIELLFSTPIDTESAKTGITLKKASGESVSFTGKAEENKYILDLTSVLEENTSYILTVAQEVKAADSDLTLTESSTVSFSTGMAQTMVNFVNITPEKLTPDTAKIAADIAAYNAGEEQLGMVVIAAFYNGDALIDIETEDLTVGIQEKLEQKIEFNVPDSQITSSKLFIWNSLNGLVPYDEARFIPYSAE